MKPLTSASRSNMPSIPTHWLPEQPLHVFPSVAIQVGVEEALLISVLAQCSFNAQIQPQHGYHWITLAQSTLEQVAPFWQPRDIQRLATNLREAGIILLASAPYSQCLQLKFAFKSPLVNQPAIPTAEQPMSQPLGAKNTIAPHWQPERDTLKQLAQHNIPEQFALAQVSEFITYWRERNEPAHSWNSKFQKHVMHKWRDYQAHQNQQPATTLMRKEWRPSEDALEVLTLHAGIHRGFIEDAIPEFVLYWREQGASSDNWNRRFRDHVNRQWIRYNATLEHDTTPRRINDGWQPSRDVYDVLRLANIDLNFAQQLVPEFVIYWRDSNQVHTSWNTRFLQYVKRRWAQREAQAQNTATTRDLSLEALVTDRSWAD